MVFQNVLNRIERPFTFVVMGDTHYAFQDLDPNLDRKTTNPQFLDRANETEVFNFPIISMLKAFKKHSPKFIVMTGDQVGGYQPGGNEKLDMHRGLKHFDVCGIPLFMVRGDQDRVEDFDRIVLPYMSQFLGHDLQDHFYFIDVNGCRLIFLNTTDWCKGSVQRAWLENLLRESTKLNIERIFLFGHHPIWPVARAFFSNLDFQQEVFEILSKYSIDAFFCGHTHNQSAILHRTGGLPTLQFMGSSVGSSEVIPTPLNLVQATLPSSNDLLAHWSGYLENTALGWYTVCVDYKSIQVNWHHLFRESELEVKWIQRGDVTSFWQAPSSSDTRLLETDLIYIRQVILRYCAWDAMQSGRQIFLNGEEMGELPPCENFSSSKLVLPSSALDYIKMDNRLEIRASNDDESALANLILEVVLPGGRLARTHPTGEIFVRSERWNAWQPRKLQRLKRSQSLQTILSFR